jgi:hypothetical protein
MFHVEHIVSRIQMDNVVMTASVYKADAGNFLASLGLKRQRLVAYVE